MFGRSFLLTLAGCESSFAAVGGGPGGAPRTGVVGAGGWLRFVLFGVGLSH